jgi:hypothetical protein
MPSNGESLEIVGGAYGLLQELILLVPDSPLEPRNGFNCE